MTSTRELSAEHLCGLRFFRGESPDAIEWIIDGCERRTLAPEEVLLEPGQSNDSVYIVLSGALQVRLERDSDAITTLGHGESAGEMSVLDQTHTSAWVIAETESELLRLDGQQMWSLITHSHIVSVNLLSILSERVRSDNRLIDKVLI